MMIIQKRSAQSGAVSLFMVIFAMLLMSIVTISFLRIMTSDQSQASSNDLSQSAYDSAQAGVEDAKRVLLKHVENCKTLSLAACEQAAAELALPICNRAIYESGVVKTADYSPLNGGAGFPEVKVQQSAVDEGGQNIAAALDQAYTCVTLVLNTEDYIVPIPANESKLIPLISTVPFQQVTLEWFERNDVPNTNGAVSLLSSGTPMLSQEADAWPTNRPALLRTQFMQVGDRFSLGSFDQMVNGESNANTLFLYPHAVGLTNTAFTQRDARKDQDGTVRAADPSSAPTRAQCRASVANGGYACSITLDLPTPVGGGEASVSYLRLTPLYRGSTVRVTLGGGAAFKAVQPKVDSTGRANDLFRRVESRIDMYDTTFPLPDAAVDVNNRFCKNFGVTDTRYIAGTTCAP